MPDDKAEPFQDPAANWSAGEAPPDRKRPYLAPHPFDESIYAGHETDSMCVFDHNPAETKDDD